LIYGSMASLAEFSLQTVRLKILPPKEKRKPYQPVTVSHYGLVGGAVFAPLLHFWYLWVDKALPGSSARTVIKKVAMDIGLTTVPTYSLFYLCLNLLAGKSLPEGMEEVKAKLAKTVLVLGAFWIPVQAVNFRFISPRGRVAFVAICTLAEFSVLAVFKSSETPSKPTPTEKHGSVVPLSGSVGLSSIGETSADLSTLLLKNCDN